MISSSLEQTRVSLAVSLSSYKKKIYIKENRVKIGRAFFERTAETTKHTRQQTDVVRDPLSAGYNTEAIVARVPLLRRACSGTSAAQRSVGATTPNS